MKKTSTQRCLGVPDVLKCRKQIPVGRGKMCPRCRHLKLKMENPLLYAYRMNRGNAKSRKTKRFPDGIPWNLTFEDWEHFWVVRYPDQWEEKRKSLTKPYKDGVTGISRRTCVWEVDRVDPEDPRGYHPENIRLVSKMMNVWFQWNPRERMMEFDLNVFIDRNPDFDWAKEVPF